MHDLLIIGGGINGAGVARDAAGRGMSVVLVEKDDLAQHTSSASTKLVHGGLRYLEHYEFRLVREALQEREVLLRAAPHIIWPLRFVLPHDAGLRPKWMLRAGLFLYDRIGGKRTLPGSSSVSLRKAPHARILQDRFRRGFEYSDCWVEDSRLVVLAAMDARERGAEIRTRTRCTGLARHADHWVATVEAGGSTSTIEARAVVNAAGPWVDDIAGLATGGSAEKHLRLVKGSHIIVPRIYAEDHCYIFQNGDGRIVFAIPYERDFTLIGTTDLLFEGDRDHPEISTEERDYLCNAASEYFREPVRAADVVSTYSGIRPLYEDHSSDNSTVTRDYMFEVDHKDQSGADAAPILSIFGGKITTFRRLAEHALERLAEQQGTTGAAWTETATLPGGGIPGGDFAGFLEERRARYPWMPYPMLLRLARAYGNRMKRIVGDANGLADMGQRIGGDLYTAELNYLVEQEFAQTADDVLWRRSKLGLHLSQAEQDMVALWFANS
ncbi:Glycerol-3-phosphate dehydrogenase [Alteripontixanthobacter maritimus]|uniref:Glycerol-3-phosphate dehydrogenase n=1 Tax=Alteripontixanthobacter maritimus TaxID=2161824 RepID=A0A369Q9J0_9SPHN|nr:glycerol-3-phosphate dehydrogenase [Alteripontixanthobacter maritimus]RDC58958.1 Glycerol-3-phosphate dehydrogenase [Alteripontixanthobacter maritimus]